MNIIDKAICNLETMRDELLRLSNDDKHYNSEWGTALHCMGWNLHSYAQELKERKYVQGVQEFNHV